MSFVEKTYLLGTGIVDGSGGQLYGSGAPYLVVTATLADVAGLRGNEAARFDHALVMCQASVLPAGESYNLYYQVSPDGVRWFTVAQFSAPVATAGLGSPPLIVNPPIGHIWRVYFAMTGAKAAAVSANVYVEFKRMGQ